MGKPTTPGITVGIDIGTTSVKAVAVRAGSDSTAHVVARARVIHPVHAPSADVFTHDAELVWVDGVRAAWEEIRRRVDRLGGPPPAALTVGAMVPSLCGVDEAGRPVTEGILYGDRRGRRADTDADADGVAGEIEGFAAALADRPGVHSLWPAQAVANHALCGHGAIDSTTAMTAMPLFDGVGWDRDRCAALGIEPDRLPAVSAGTAPIGATHRGTLVGGGTIDALAEQLVADAGDPGDVLVICGTTLIPWAVVPETEWRDVDGLWTVPYTAPGTIAIGGASNAGGLFLDRVRRVTGAISDEAIDALPPDGLPVWLPYVRGERTPLHDPDRRAELLDLSVQHDGAHVLRAAYEAAGFVVRHHLDLVADGGGTPATRIVASGGGTRSAPWMQALADATGLPVDVAAAPEGAAIGAAFLGRATAGLDDSAVSGRGWSPTAQRVQPRPAWQGAMEHRYRRFRSGTMR